MHQLITLAQAAELTAVSTRTVRRWISSGLARDAAATGADAPRQVRRPGRARRARAAADGDAVTQPPDPQADGRAARGPITAPHPWADSSRGVCAAARPFP